MLTFLIKLYSKVGAAVLAGGIAVAVPYVLLDYVPFPWNRRKYHPARTNSKPPHATGSPNKYQCLGTVRRHALRRLRGAIGAEISCAQVNPGPARVRGSARMVSAFPRSRLRLGSLSTSVSPHGSSVAVHLGKSTLQCLGAVRGAAPPVGSFYAMLMRTKWAPPPGASQRRRAPA